MKLDLHGITRMYNDRAVVRDVTLSVGEGAFVALVGPSGAGKTTLLRIIAGLEPDYAGRLLIDGRDMTDVPARHRNIGFVFQNYALFRHLDVAENVAFGLRALRHGRRPSRATIRQRVQELLELVQVAELAARRPAQLSGGQRQRVALARALATEPALLLLDEPFGALDPMVRKDIRTWLRGLHDRLGLTSLFVTHDQAEAAELADRLAVLRGGRLVQVGSPTELDANPADPFVVHFLGDCVGFEGEVRDGRFHADTHDLAPFETDAEPGRAVALVRPYDLLMRHGGAARVLGSRALGGFVRVRVRTEHREIETLAPAGTPELPAGAAVSLQVRRAHVFPLARPPLETRSAPLNLQLDEEV
jgi:sulfate transport system ATP-binding protein